MLDTRYTYDGPRFDIMGRELPARERSNSFEAEQVYHSDLLKKDFTNPNVMAHEERLELMRRATPSEEELALEAMPREEWEPLLRGKARQEYAVLTAPVRQTTGDIFVLAHPEMRDDLPNAHKLVAKIQERKDILDATIEDYEAAYQWLVARGELTLNKAVLAKQERERIVAAAREHQDKTKFDAEAAYEMPMDELYQCAGGRSQW